MGAGESLYLCQDVFDSTLDFVLCFSRLRVNPVCTFDSVVLVGTRNEKAQTGARALMRVVLIDDMQAKAI